MGKISTATSASADSAATAHDFRDYQKAPKRVRQNYRLNHTNQHYDWALAQRQKYSRCDSGFEMSIWEAAEKLNELIDDSDPDINLPQIEHLLQTAEALRKKYPGEEYDWFHLTGLIHDLGKVLAHPEFFDQPQWAVVGDTYPLGCPFDEKIVYHKYFVHNPDSSRPEFSTGTGIYEPGCGFRNVLMSWGHDEYMYQVCVQNKCTLPEKALYIIRFHSFYPFHQGETYKDLMDDTDREMLFWLKEFQKCDLYSKEDTKVNVEELKIYYQGLIAKYFPPKLKW